MTQSLSATALSKVCNKCEETKPITEFSKNRGKCKTCEKLRYKLYRDANKDKVKKSKINQTYGLEPEAYDAMVQSTPHCPICGSEEPLVVDHDHSTSEVRGLICHHCNTGLGLFRDNIESLKNAIKYLEQ